MAARDLSPTNLLPPPQMQSAIDMQTLALFSAWVLNSSKHSFVVHVQF